MSGTASLPRGLRQARMRAMDGATELALAEALEGAGSRPEAVTAVLAALLESVADVPATPEAVRALPAADREWLLQWASARLHPQVHWFESRCELCGEPYDVSIQLAQPAYRPPRQPGSSVAVETSLGRRHFAVPTGEHEERLALLSDGDDDPRRLFAALCGLSDEASREAWLFEEHDLELIEEALEAASPEVADGVEVTCPSCGEATFGRLDPLQFALPHSGAILREIHLIARAYGWSLGDILALKARQRSNFAEMIRRDRPSSRTGWGGR